MQQIVYSRIFSKGCLLLQQFSYWYPRTIHALTTQLGCGAFKKKTQCEIALSTDIIVFLHVEPLRILSRISATDTSVCEIFSGKKILHTEQQTPKEPRSEISELKVERNIFNSPMKSHKTLQSFYCGLLSPILLSKNC